MIEIDSILFYILFVFAMVGFLFSWVSFLNWIFKLGRNRSERQEEQKKLQQKIEKILNKIEEMKCLH